MGLRPPAKKNTQQCLVEKTFLNERNTASSAKLSPLRILNGGDVLQSLSAKAMDLLLSTLIGVTEAQ